MRRTKLPTVTIRNRQKNLRLDLPALRRVVQAVLSVPSSTFQVQCSELSFVFVTDEEIARLNDQFLNHQGPTDVITFEHGEIVISTDRAVAQAKQFKSPLHEELALYLIHGLLHLAGYDDTSPVPRRAMHRRQREILRDLRKKLDLRKLLR